MIGTRLLIAQNRHAVTSHLMVITYLPRPMDSQGRAALRRCVEELVPADQSQMWDRRQNKKLWDYIGHRESVLSCCFWDVNGQTL